MQQSHHDNSTNYVEIYVDGSCLHNPGPGGWGVLMIWKEHEREFSGFESNATNNRMELMAAIQALETLKRPISVKIYTDSKYVKDGITKWLQTWKAKNWKTAARKPVANQDLWQRLEEATQRFEGAMPSHGIEWIWVKGHHTSQGNNRADALARSAAMSNQ